MRILLTGAFGNIGMRTCRELLKRGHQVRAFDLRTPANLRAWRAYEGQLEVVWGDLRNPKDIQTAVKDQEAVVHLAFVIPHLSHTGRGSEEAPEWAYAVNVGGTENLIGALQQSGPNARLLFTSSLHIYGRTQDQPPPRTLQDQPQPIEHYAHHKVACERLVAASGLTWAIYRLAASLPVRLVLDEGMFQVPLDNRIEFVHSEDVATAIANGLEGEAIWGRRWHIGGGQSCQLYQRELVEGVLEAVGVGMLPEEAFTQVPYPTDWLDTRESQRVLQFQLRTLRDYIQDVRARIGIWRPFIRMFSPLIRAWLLSRARWARSNANG